MKNVKLKAIKQCGKAAPGQTFFESTAIAKAIVALRRAEYFVTEKTVDLFGDVTGFGEDELNHGALGADGLLISDSVREYAQQHGIDVNGITGTGKDGRINRKDIEIAIDKIAVSSPPENKVDA